MFPSNHTTTNNTKSLSTTSNTLRPPLLPKDGYLPIKKLTTAKLQSRREKGLRYNCDDRYFSGHKCKN